MMNRPRITLPKGFDLAISPSFSLKLPSPLSLDGPAIIGVAGPNGAGKSTFLKLLAGLLDLEAARMIESEIKIEASPSPLAWMPTQTSPNFELSVEEFLLLGRYPLHQGYPSKADHLQCRKLLDKLGISALALQSYQSLSSGEQRKVSLARTLAAERQVILLDEPLSHLDPKAAQEMARLIVDLKTEGKLIILSIHDPNMAMQLCDSILFLKAGRIATEAKAPATIPLSLLEAIYGIPFRSIPDSSSNSHQSYFLPQSHLVP